MSTHNIGFYEDLTKIIFELSSNIIKYAPYFFCCFHLRKAVASVNISSFCCENFRPSGYVSNIVAKQHLSKQTS